MLCSLQTISSILSDSCFLGIFPRKCWLQWCPGLRGQFGGTQAHLEFFVDSVKEAE